MTIELVKILEAAKYHDDKAMRWFEEYQKTENDFWFHMSKEQKMIVQGLLEAYEILTGKKIYHHEIDKELALC